LSVELLRERVADRHEWWRIADPAWTDPLDPGFAKRHGGRWNPPDSFAALYLNQDLATARANFKAFVAAWPYEPEDIRDDTGPLLIACALPRRQIVCDVHSPAGVRAAGLPDTYPLEHDGSPVRHGRCQPIGARAKAERLRGVRARSAQTADGTSRELAWFPASVRSRARRRDTLAYTAWFRE
jgi:hypothetical protein